MQLYNSIQYNNTKWSLQPTQYRMINIEAKRFNLHLTTENKNTIHAYHYIS